LWGSPRFAGALPAQLNSAKALRIAYLTGQAQLNSAKALRIAYLTGQAQLNSAEALRIAYLTTNDVFM